MSSTIVFNGTSYSIPSEGDSSWGTDLSNYLIAIASGSLQKSGGSFALTADVNFGTNFGLKAQYLKSQGTNPASTGVMRLANAESIKWRNQANNADLDLTVNASNNLQFNGANILSAGAASIVDADVSPSAAIAYSKLNLASSIVNDDISSSAAIAYSKLNIADNDLTISKTNGLQTALDNLQTNIDNHVSDVTGAHAASAISFSPVGTIAASDVQSAVAEVATDAATDLSNHEADTTAIHGIADTADLLTTSNTKTVTNKDIDGGTASDTSRITIPKAAKTTLDALTRKQGTIVYDTTLNKPYYDDGSTLKVIGSGSGSSVNFVNDGDGEALNIFSQYNDSSTTRPVDGTGGTATNLSSAVSSTSPLAGTQSFILTKSGSASTQGMGWSVPTTSIDTAYRAKVLQIEFDYVVASGTFVAGSSTAESDVIVYLYDVTNSQLIEPSSIKLLSNSTTISDKFVANFQTSATGTQYRLILHCQSTSTANYSLKLDNIAIRPCNYVYGTPITDWVSYNYTGFTSSNGVMNSKWRRVGDTMEVRQNVEWSGAAGAFSGVFGLPSGFSIDTTKLALGTVALDRINLGDAQFLDSGAFIYKGFVTYRDATTVNVWQSDASISTTRNAIITATSPFSFGASDTINISYSVPIQGWSSSVQQSDGYDGRLIAARYTGAPSGTPAGIHTTVTYPTKAFDTTNSYSAGTYTVPSSGTYFVSATIEVAGTESLNNIVNVAVYVDGTASLFGVSPRAPGTVTNTQSTVSGLVELRAGQLVTIKVYTDIGSPSFTSGDTTPGFHIFKINSPTTISATEKVVATYKTLSSTTITSGTALKFTTLVEDSHGRYNTSSGAYVIDSQGTYEFIISGINAGAATDLKMFNGATDLGVIGSLASGTGRQSVTIQYPFNAGDSITFVPQASSSATDTVGWLMVKKIK